MHHDLVVLKADTVSDTAGSSGTAADTVSEKNASQVRLCDSVLSVKCCVA